ncbi:MAG: sodium:calcium antiporter [bacterium]|nr:sodium:calcium antiporter [bacterium]
MTHAPKTYEVTPGLYISFLITALVTIPGFYFGITHTEIAPQWGSLLFGLAIFGAAFMLSWAAELAQLEMSESLAVAILALVAVLPEYAVDFVFTWKAAHDPGHANNAIANMTGANRLLVGLGWPFILFLYVWVRKKTAVVLDSSQRIEVFYLAAATIYSFTIPLKGSLNLIDTVILVTIFGLYTRRVAQMESTEPELVGPVKIFANLQRGPRIFWTAALFVWSGGVIFFVSEPFAMSLVGMGTIFGISEFKLVQWLAPIASEAPEFIIAATWTMRGAANSAMKALISSKVNQWTLLVGTIPLVYAISGRAIKPFVFNSLQTHELFLTAAQSLFGVAVLLNLRINRMEGSLLLGLFILQFLIEGIRMEVAYIYIAIAIVYHVVERKHLWPAAVGGLGLKKK